ncbi:MAG: VOC family protein [Geodermatophilaceae bacterium]|nr:VOC family protein [Geodermatophilaceae bacterium]
MTDITGWAHVTLSVRQHDLSVQWYSDVLGFHALASETTDRWQRTLCQHPQSGVSLVLHQHVPTSSDEFDERQIGLDHVALSTSTFDGLHAWEERLTEMGVLHSPLTLPCSVSWSRRRVHDDRRDAATRRSVRDEVAGLEPANLGAIRAYPGELPAVQCAGAVQDDRLGSELYAAVVAR